MYLVIEERREGRGREKGRRGRRNRFIELDPFGDLFLLFEREWGIDFGYRLVPFALVTSVVVCLNYLSVSGGILLKVFRSEE